MIIHISNKRLEAIKSQGYNVEIHVREDAASCGPLGLMAIGYVEAVERSGDTVLHVIADERAKCDICGDEFDSIIADTPAELETVKFTLSRLHAFGELTAQSTDFHL